MRFLFLLISIIYSFNFYIFYTLSLKKDIFFRDLESIKNSDIINLSIKDHIIFSSENTLVIQSFFGNIIYELSFFIIVGIILFFYFGSIGKKNKILEEKNELHNLENKINKEDVIRVFKGFGYYFGFILFYLSIYLISKSFEIFNFSFFILVLNLIVYIYYFFSKFSNLSKDFLKTNLFIFSFYYLINYFSIIIGGNNFFTYIDFINSFLIILIFPTILYFDKIFSKKEHFDYIFLVNFSIYIFGVFLFYFYIFNNKNILFWITILSTLFGILWFEFLPKINYLKKDKVVFRYIGIIFGYIGMILGYIHLFIDFNYFILFILMIQCYYNFFIHKKYINIVSFLLSIFGGLFLIYFIILKFNLLDFRGFYFFLFSLILSFLIILLGYLFKFKTIYDIYILYGISYFINILTIIMFFIFMNINFLNIGILLFLESIYFFLSYNKLKLS